MASEEIYETQQFGQKIGVGQRPGLLVVDFVNGFADPQILGGGNIRDAIVATAPLLLFFRERQLPVISTRIGTQRMVPTREFGARRRLACAC